MSALFISAFCNACLRHTPVDASYIRMRPAADLLSCLFQFNAMSGIRAGRCSEHDLSFPEGHKHQVGDLCRTQIPHLIQQYAKHIATYTLKLTLGGTALC